MKSWLKFIAIGLILYVHIAGLLMDVPRLAILNETIRALYFHVPMWFGMIFLLLLSMTAAIIYLIIPEPIYDRYSVALTNIGVLYCILGLLTGMFWANYTWGSPWHGDSKQNNSAIALLIYVAYFILRGALENREQKARLSAVYNIFAFFALIPLLFILPRMEASMHPGNGGNPGFNTYDLDSRMRMVFYPAVIGWILVGIWMTTLQVRLFAAKDKLEEFLIN